MSTGPTAHSRCWPPGWGCGLGRCRFCWFSGNIGLHHIHHLNARIPNYRLQQCHHENPQFQQVTTLTLWSSLTCIGLTLWDEEQRRLVGFGHLKAGLRTGQYLDLVG
jgi:fatty acid desaturase